MAQYPVEFSTLISAAKPKQRTDRYKVLSALFCLDAHSKPIVAKEVIALLKLHYGGHAPSNVNNLLRKYSSYVQPVDKGPPLTWKLTNKGLEFLRTESGLSLTAATTEDFQADVGVVCALEHPEFVSLMEAAGGAEKWSAIGSARFAHVYRETHIQTNLGRKLRIVGTTATSMGLTAAAIATTQLILQFKPRLVMMTGIAAGTRSGNKQFGDVLVADPSVDYNSGKVAESNGIRDFLPDPYPIGLIARLRSVLQKYRGDHAVFSKIRQKWRGGKPAGKNKLHLGPLGAADQVIDDATRITEIQRNWRKLIGVEMETYGVYRACYESPDPKPRFVSFKAVCDFAAEKEDSWQPYAAFMAAEFAVEFLKADWEVLWPADLK